MSEAWRREYPIRPADGFDDQSIVVLFQNGLPDLPMVLIKPHRSRGGIWRIKSAMTLTTTLDERRALATDLYQLGEHELAGEIDDAKRDALRLDLK